MPPVLIAIEDPGLPDIRDLLAERDRFFASLYAEPSHSPKSVDFADPRLVFLVLRDGGRPVGCGALVGRRDYGELKRVYVASGHRGLGLGRRIVAALEAEARARGHRLLRLETGIRQPEAQALYAALGYRLTGPFGSHGEDPLSLFMEKRLS